MREQYPNAYSPWSKADETRPVALYQAGWRDYVVLDEDFARQPSVIRSCLEKIAIERLRHSEGLFTRSYQWLKGFDPSPAQ